MNSEAHTPARVDEFLTWVEVNKKKVAVLFLAAVVIGFGIYIYRWQSAQTEQEANRALLALRTTAGAGPEAAPAPAAEFLRVAESYRGTTARERALLLAAGAFFREGEYGQAEEQFNRFLSDHGRSLWAPSAAYGLAASLEAQGKLEEAANAYSNVISRYPNEAVVTEAKLGMARIHELRERPEEAVKIYDELAGMTPATAWTGQARMHRERLVALHPELQPTRTLEIGNGQSIQVVDPPGATVEIVPTEP
jgi:tetratricopeptide (TPR) repeat protein